MSLSSCSSIEEKLEAREVTENCRLTRGGNLEMVVIVEG